MIKCKDCGKQHNENQWMESFAEELRKQQLCYSCHFWTEKLNLKEEAGRIPVRIAGHHYTVVPDAPRGSPFQGYGGAKQTIKLADGRVIVTRNLWHQGEIPEHFRARMPDNAEMVEL